MRRLDLGLSPEDVLASWPADVGLAAVWAGEPGAWSRWTLLGVPVGRFVVRRAGPGGGARSSWEPSPNAPTQDARSRAVQLSHEFSHRFSHDPIEDLRRALQAFPRRPGAPDDPDAPSMVGGWIGALSYDLGRVLEPTAHAGRAWGDGGVPMIDLQRLGGAYAYDGLRDAWWVIGDAAVLPGVPALRAGREARAARAGFFASRRDEPGAREAFERNVARGVQLIHAGDAFQVNLAHTLSGPFEGSTREAFLGLVRGARPRHGVYLERDEPDGERQALLSASPELFLRLEPGPQGLRAATRPMKGTRAGEGDAHDLARSAKDRAELAMIVDLMRNDLGRVAEFGSVRVDDPGVVERHGGRSGSEGVLQGVASVSARLRPGVGAAELLRAAFPPGSVTGAPKVRAMQIIDELEDRARGAYCGCAGWLGDDGAALLNVCIRTMEVRGAPAAGGLDRVRAGSWSYGVGAGIVADSEPASEWRETLVKARPLGALGLAPGSGS